MARTSAKEHAERIEKSADRYSAPVPVRSSTAYVLHISQKSPDGPTGDQERLKRWDLAAVRIEDEGRRSRVGIGQIHQSHSCTSIKCKYLPCVFL